jgi:hypothetical protein
MTLTDKRQHMRPSDVLDEQVRLVRYFRSDTGKQMITTFVEEEVRKTGMLMGYYKEPHRLAEAEAWNLDRAPTYLIESDMVALAEGASHKMPPEPLMEYDVPSSRGFAWLDQPIYLVDVNRKRLNIRAVHWYPSKIVMAEAPIRGTRPDTTVNHEGLWITLYNDLQAPDDPDAEMLHRYVQEHAIPTPRLSTLHFDGWPWGTNYCLGQTEEEVEKYEWVFHHDEGPVVEMRRFLASFWRLIQQRIAIPVLHQVDRATRRRAERVLTQVSPEITVVTLRRLKHPDRWDPDHEPEPANYSHRFPVDGHWRNQWFPSLKQHRRILIPLYIKGPDHLPLVVKDRVYRWSR